MAGGFIQRSEHATFKKRQNSLRKSNEGPIHTPLRLMCPGKYRIDDEEKFEARIHYNLVMSDTDASLVTIFWLTSSKQS